MSHAYSIPIEDDCRYGNNRPMTPKPKAPEAQNPQAERTIHVPADFLKQVRLEMAKKSLKQIDLARLAKVDPATISRILSGDRPATTDHIKQIGRVLDIDPLPYLRRALEKIQNELRPLDEEFGRGVLEHTSISPPGSLKDFLASVGPDLTTRERHMLYALGEFAKDAGDLKEDFWPSFVRLWRSSVTSKL